MTTFGKLEQLLRLAVIRGASFARPVPAVAQSWGMEVPGGEP